MILVILCIHLTSIFRVSSKRADHEFMPSIETLNIAADIHAARHKSCVQNELYESESEGEQSQPEPCAVCTDTHEDIAVLRCGHREVCRFCLRRVARAKCLIFRAIVSYVQELFSGMRMRVRIGPPLCVPVTINFLRADTNARSSNRADDNRHVKSHNVSSFPSSFIHTITHT